MSDFHLIAIDGPSGVGKSSTARALAERLGYYFLSSGRIYRAMAWYALEQGWQPGAAVPDGLFDGVRIEMDADGGLRVDGRPVAAELGAEAISRAASLISQVPAVRDRCNQVQRETVAAIAGRGRYAGVILEGRDIATVVFPDATHKFFITASPRERARRRHAELAASAPGVSVEEVARTIAERDERDRTREVAPLRAAEDAVVIDTSALSLEQVVDRLAREIRGD